MEIFLATLVMLGLIGISNVVNRFVPFIPVPLIQMALGVVVALMPKGVHLTLEPELFFVLFIAPLLYNDGKHTPRNELWRLRAPILLMAVVLVFITVFVVGYAIHWMIPSIPLAAAFGLAAILSPTDAVAVGALAGRIHLPKSLMRLLEGEALMNDASGLVAFKFAIAAAVTGAFSLSKASVSFLVISIGGLVIGAILAFLITGARKLLRQVGMEDVTMHMLLQILTPFLLYLTAEELGMSGILAAVAGGIVHAIEHDRSEAANLKLNAASASTWSVILFILNGLVFVVLGLQIPGVSRTILSDPAFDNMKVAGYAILIFVMLIALRFLWSFLFTRVSWLAGKKNGEKAPDLKILAMVSISGVRGAVTLAGAFSIPLVVDTGSLFPERDLIIFLAAAVILLSLLAASVLLPLLAKSKKSDNDAGGELLNRELQIRVMTAAVQALRQELREDNEAVIASVIADYKKWMQQAAAKDRPRKGRRSNVKEMELRLLALNAEREFIHTLLNNGEISREYANALFMTLDQIEMILSNRTHLWKAMFKLFIRRIRSFLSGKKQRRFLDLDIAKFHSMRLKSCEAAIHALRKNSVPETQEETNAVIGYYHHAMDRINRFSPVSRHLDEAQEEERKELHWMAIQAERNYVQSLYEKGEITRQQANELRRLIREREAVMLEQSGIE